ncbi:MAG TPA: NAD(P)-dependent oxidoreductase [Nitrospira sp.]|nr:NAD(P)-dependent oxidoreductase [Nitrospira sp.]
MPEPTESIGFVGVGRMGANMSRCLHERGLHLTSVYDVYSAAAVKLSMELGVHQAHTPAEVADRASVIITVVSDDAAMRSIFSATDNTSLLGNARGRLFINCATLSPQTHQDIAGLISGRGGLYLEACMAGSITQARQGTLYLLCGGNPETYARAKVILEALGTTVRYIGRTGEAATVKALVNMVMNSNTAALAEGLGLGAALGIDLALLRDVFSQTGAASRVLETDGDDMQQRAHDCYFSAAHAAKDSAIALDLAQQVGISLPVAQATLAQYRRLIALGKGELDKSAIAELTFVDRVGPPSNLH